ncbi:sensor histidine kinase [Paenibacillus sp. LjRoot153]|uniref:sensor histidine kinase n=1 Tax=Paenibacillus sp. LjRoot153 TaxID=3342270 RepID=UPI003F5014AD
MITLSVMPLCVLGFVSFNIAKDTLVQNHEQTNENHLRTASEVADLLLRNVINMNRVVLSDNQLREQLIESGRNGAASTIGVRTVQRLEHIVLSNLVDSQYFDSVCLFDREFHSTCYGRSESAGLYGTNQTRMNISKTEWYDPVIRARGKEVFFSYNVLDPYTSKESFSSVKLLRDPDNLESEPIGLLVTNIKKSMFQTVIHESDNSSFLVMNPIASSSSSMVYANKIDVLKEVSIEDGMENLVQNLEQTGYLITRYTNQTTGWTFMHIIEAKELLKQSNRIGVATAIISAIIAFISLLFAFWIARSITRPLLQLKKMILEWSTGVKNWFGNFEADEVGTIGETFKRMAIENVQLGERLIDSQLKEREAELNTLQAQIKPHFLYNTLDSIYWMAIMHDTPDIALMADSLSESFRLSLNKGKETIPFFKELKHIEHYMTIQNIRFNHRFTYIEHVDPSLMGIDFLKLLLQPLVENAIYHGLEPKIGPGTIRLTARREGKDVVIFTVEDDGVGIEDLTLIEQGYGLRNVRERVMLYYGNQSSFTFASQPNEGTKIDIRIRLHTEGQ